MLAFDFLNSIGTVEDGYDDFLGYVKNLFIVDSNLTSEQKESMSDLQDEIFSSLSVMMFGYYSYFIDGDHASGVEFLSIEELYQKYQGLTEEEKEYIDKSWGVGVRHLLKAYENLDFYKDEEVQVFVNEVFEKLMECIMIEDPADQLSAFEEVEEFLDNAPFSAEKKTFFEETLTYDYYKAAIFIYRGSDAKFEEFRDKISNSETGRKECLHCRIL